MQVTCIPVEHFAQYVQSSQDHSSGSQIFMDPSHSYVYIVPIAHGVSEDVPRNIVSIPQKNSHQSASRSHKAPLPPILGMIQ
jgi:hypothetical protein